MERIELLGTYIDNFTMEETVNEVEKYILEHKPLHLIGLNAEKINELNDDEYLKAIVDQCAIINADGASVVWASKVLNTPLKERVAGIDLMQELLKLSETKGYYVYFLGAKQDVVENMVTRLKITYPNLKIAGYRNGYFSKEEWPEISKMLKEGEAQIVFVGITSPLKEHLIDFFQKDNSKAVYMGVGGSFDVLSGKIPRAPKTMQKYGLEWMFRMLQEPGRLAERYLKGNLKFIIRVYREKFFKERKKD